jgi:hypothetical protein
MQPQVTFANFSGKAVVNIHVPDNPGGWGVVRRRTDPADGYHYQWSGN